MSQLRVWEETWLFTGEAVETHDGCTLLHDDPDDEGEVEQGQQARLRLRLTAQAPAMARTLMTLAGMGTDKYCNGCGDTTNRGHSQDCTLLALLFEAGVGDMSEGARPTCLRVVK